MSEITPRVARQHCRRRVETIRKSVIKMIDWWADQDQSVVDELEAAYRLMEDIENVMDDAVVDYDEAGHEPT